MQVKHFRNKNQEFHSNLFHVLQHLCVDKGVSINTPQVVQMIPFCKRSGVWGRGAAAWGW